MMDMLTLTEHNGALRLCGNHQNNTDARFCKVYFPNDYDYDCSNVIVHWADELNNRNVGFLGGKPMYVGDFAMIIRPPRSALKGIGRGSNESGSSDK